MGVFPQSADLRGSGVLPAIRYFLGSFKPGFVTISPGFSPSRPESGGDREHGCGLWRGLLEDMLGIRSYRNGGSQRVLLAGLSTSQVTETCHNVTGTKTVET